MQGSRSRFPNRASSSSYGSWGGRSSRETETEEKKQLLDVLEKFRSLRPYLTKRLKSITSAGRERELAELVDDIKYYLNVMNDLVADEHHGIETILSFIETIHEMIRADPDPIETRQLHDEVDDEDDYNNQPRSPSPPSSPYGSSNSQSTHPRIIPSERERNDFNNPYQDNDTRHLATDVWDNSAREGFTYTRRSDVDMRVHDIRTPHSDFQTGGRSSSFRNTDSRSSSDNLDMHDIRTPQSDFHAGGRSSSFRNTDSRSSSDNLDIHDIRTPQSDFHAGGRSSSFRNTDSRSSSDNLDIHDIRTPQSDFHAGGSSSSFRRNDSRSSSDNLDSHDNYGYSGQGHSWGRDRNWMGSDRDIDHRDSDMRSPTFPTPSAASVNPPPLIPPAVVARNVPSTSVPNVDLNVSANSNLLHPTNQFNNPNINAFQAQINMAQQMVSNTSFTNQTQVAQLQAMMQAMLQNMTQQQQQQQQHNANPPLLSPQNVNPMMLNNQNPQGLANPNMNLQANNQNQSNINMNPQTLMSNQNINRPNIPNQNTNMGMRQPHMGGYSQNPNRFRGLLPTPPARGDFRFQNRTGSRMPRPNLDAHPPNTMNNYPPRHSNPNANPSSNSMINQIIQKAQHHFSRATRPSFGRRDGPNFTNGPSPDVQGFRNPSPVPTNKPPQLATNQMLADVSTLDPRVYRNNRPNQPREQSQNQNKESCTNNDLNNSPNDSCISNIRRAPESIPNKRPSDPPRSNEVAKNNSDKGRVNNPPPKKVDKVNKLSELKEQLAAKGDFIKLGEKPSKNKIRFEEALCLAPSKSTKKPPAVVTKAKTNTSSASDGQDNNKVLGSQKNTTTDKEKTKTAKLVDSKSTKSRNSRSAADNQNRLRSSKPKEPKPSGSQLKTSEELSKTTKTGASSFKFKIPKIKKPAPIEEIPPETPSPMDPHEIGEQTESSDKDLSTTDDTMADKSSSKAADLSLGDNAEELIKTFITKSMAPDDVERLNSNPDAYMEIAKKLQEHLKKIVTSDMDDKPSTSNSEAGSSKTGNTGEADRDSSTDKTVESPPTKKRGGKRRSDLEKLHDALKEMRFDSMLPLGPRRCTNKGQLDDDADNVNKEPNAQPEDLPDVLETVVPAKSTIDEIIEEQANLGASKSQSKKAKPKKVTNPKKSVTPKPPLKAKKVVQTKKPPVIKKGKAGKITKKAVVKKTKSTTDLPNEKESEVPEKPKAKRGRKRKISTPSNEVPTAAAAGSTVADKENPAPPRRYLTRLQAKRIANPPSPEVQIRPARTGWEQWNKKLAVLKKRQEEKNKKFAATFSASKIKLKIKNSIKNQLKRKNDKLGHLPQQPWKKPKVGPNSIVVNSALGKIKIESDYLPIVAVKSEDVNTPECNDNADMNHLIFDPESAVRSVVNVFNTNPSVSDSNEVAIDFDASQASLPEVTNADFESMDFTVPEFETGFDKDTDISIPEVQDNDMEVLRSIDPDLPVASMETEEDPPPPDLEISTDSGVATRKGRVRKIRSDLFSCRLCPFNGKKIVAHYVNVHRGQTIPEVCISQEAFDSLVDQNLSTAPQLFDISYCDSEEENPWPCLYCTDRFNDVRDYFEHLTTHTGEYLYGCGVCDMRHPYFKTIMSHLKSHKLKEGELVKNLINVYEPTVSSGGHELFAYVCNDCRYFQLLTENIASHLETEDHSPGEAISLKFHGPRSQPSGSSMKKDTEAFNTSVFLGTSDKMLKMDENLILKREQLTVDNAHLRLSPSAFLEIASRNPYWSDLDGSKRIDEMKMEATEVFPIESENQIENGCKETLNWLVGIVESKVEPNLSFDKEIVKSSKNFHYFIPPLEEKPTVSDSEEEYTEYNIMEDDAESWCQEGMENNEAPQDTFQTIIPQDQYELIVKYRNNKNAIIDHDWPKFIKYKKGFVGIKRIGDGFEHIVLLNGFSYPQKKGQSIPESETVPELQKLQVGCVGEKRIVLKEIDAFNNMLTKPKLRDMYKCMGASCSYTGNDDEEFIIHLACHGMKREMTSSNDTSNANWNCCCYCSLQYKSAKDLCDHIKNQHSKSAYQCNMCFYRGFKPIYLIKHHKLVHPKAEKPVILCCTPVVKSNYVESTKVTFNVYRCVTCKLSSNENPRKYHLRDEFLEHLENCIPADSLYTCHLCNSKYSDKRHLVYHYKQHSVFRFHCSYCPFGSEVREDMQSHFFEVHPNLSGRLFDRDPSNKDNEDSPPKKIPKVIEEVDLVTPETSPEKKTEKPGPSRECKEENASRRLSFEAEDKEGRITNLEGVNLYRCGNEPCNFSSKDATSYKDHVSTCLNEAGLIPCCHCSRKMKSVFSLMEHLKVHGKQRQFCSLCPFKCCVNSELTKHFKNVHRVSNYRVLKSEESANDPEATVYPKESSAKGLSPDVLQSTHMLYSNKALFTPSDTDKIPSPSVFSSFVYCALCPFNTKVRSNLVRHLKLHEQADEEGGKKLVANTVPVNPVPCLSRNEMFFDKMTNWAGSSHQKNNGSGVTKEDASKLPQFVKEQFRFECSVSNCQQITVDDSMLKAHMRALHSDVDLYKCPHCLKNGTSDSRNAVPIDRIGIHLKLHGPKLYRCGHCDYIQTQTRIVEKHVAEKHVEKKPIHYLIRDFDEDGNMMSRRVSVEENPKANDAWRCTLCAYKTQFTTWEEAKHHCTKSHNVSNQLVCSACGFSSDMVFQMVSHVQRNECGEISSSAEKGRILIMFCRNEAITTSESKDEVGSLPIWRRTSLGMKHIRGIFLEEDKQLKQLQSKAEANNSPSKSSSSSNVGKSPVKNSQPLNNKTISSSSKTNNIGSPKAKNTANANEVSKPPLLRKADDGSSLPGTWVCPKCQKYKTKNPNDLVIHIHNEYNYRRYKCKLCDHKCVTENSLKGHIIGDHQVSYNYSLCDLLPQDTSVEDYVRKCLDEQLAAGKKDVSSEKAAEQVDDNNLKCKHCHMMFASYHNYRTHILAKHVAANRFSCKYCPLAFWNEGIAKQHHFRSTHASKPFAVVRNEELEAKLTPEFWFTEYGIPISKSVKYSAMGSTILHCDQCMFKTNQSFKLAQHKLDQHEIPQEEPAGNEETEMDTDTDIPTDFIDLTSEMQKMLVKSSTTLSTSSSPLLDSDISMVKKQRVDKPNIYKCFHCNKNCFTAKGMRQHWLKHHSSNQGLECSYYEFKCFKDSMQMLPGIELMCPYCPHSENSIAGMRVHNSLSHSDKHFRLKRRELSNTTILVCALCEFQGRTFNNIKKHSDQSHPGKVPLFTKLELTPVERICTPMGKLIEDKVMYGCNICSCDYPSPFTFKQHIIGRENHEDCDPMVKYNRCVIQENVEIPQDEDLDVVTGDENFKCPSCTYETEDRNVMIQNHLATHIKAFICPLCDHGFEISIDTLFHIRHYHHDARQIPVCNKSAYLSYLALKDEIVVTYRSDSNAQKK